LIGVGAAALTVEILKRNTFPTNFALCFMATFVFLVVSYVALALCHEPEAATPRSERRVRGIRQYLASLPSFLRHERNFAVFLMATVLGNILMAIAPFVAASTSRALHASDAQVGAYGVALLAVSTCGSLCWGWLGDHFGYRLVLIGGNIAGLLTMCVALIGLARHDLLIFFGVFGLLGIYTSATQLASFTIVTEFGTLEERPTFIALSSLVLAPVAIVAPIVAGIVADAFGYNAIFVVAGISLACAAMLLTVGVRDPRQFGESVVPAP
jgi:MFS family permease